MPWVITAAVLVVALVALGLAWRVRKDRDRLRARTEVDQDRLARQAADLEHLERRNRALREELAEQFRIIDDLMGRLGRDDSARVRGLWALEELRQRRAAGEPDPALLGPAFDGTGLGDPSLEDASLEELAGEASYEGSGDVPGLLDVLHRELELVREEVGTPAELAAFEVPAPLDAGLALGVLRVVQELAAALARRSDELVFTIATEPGATVVTVWADGWSEPDVPGRAHLESALGAFGGGLTIEPEDKALVATARLKGGVLTDPTGPVAV